MSTLTERLAIDPVVWKPENVGDAIEGTLLDLEYRTSDYGDEVFPVLTIQADNGDEFIWFASQASALNQVKKLNPQPGERVGASFRGLGDAKPGQSPPKRFRVLVDRPVGAKPPEPTAEPAPPVPDDDDIPF